MKNQANIRNIGIVAHIDHGKCIGPDERLVLYNGESIKAKDLFEELKTNGVLAAKDEEKEVYEITSPHFVFSLNKETGKMEKKPVTHAWKFNNKTEMKNVRLRNGFSVCTTPEHGFLALKDLKFEFIEAKDLSKGSAIVSARKLSASSGENFKEQILEKLSQKQFYVSLSKEMKEKINENLGKSKEKKKITLQNCSISTKFSTFYFGLRKNRLLLNDVFSLSKYFKISPNELFENIETINFGCGRKNIFPKNLENFYYLAGLFVGDGSERRFVVGKPYLEKRFVEICNAFGFNPKEKIVPGKTKELYANKTILELLNSIFDYTKKMKSHNVRISKILESSPDTLVACFLRGYFDCDGTVEKGRNAISITSASTQMLKDLQITLLRFGCISIVNKNDNTLYISGVSAKHFVNHIGFEIEEKMSKATNLAQKSTGSQVCDLVPIGNGLNSFRNMQKNFVSMTSIGHHYYKYENGQYSPTVTTFAQIVGSFKQKGIEIKALEKINTEELAFVEVEEISNEYFKEVYDFTVADNHNFIANGVVVHNTTMTDSLVAASGLMSEALAGKQLVMDFEDQEQARGITINAANISITQKIGDQEYLINIIDTPGHVDFGGEVLRNEGS